jgi:hypothetical protein
LGCRDGREGGGSGLLGGGGVRCAEGMRLAFLRQWEVGGEVSRR